MVTETVDMIEIPYDEVLAEINLIEHDFTDRSEYLKKEETDNKETSCKL